MSETKTQIRLATTAIVAALAISSTPLLAQDAPPPDTSVETPVTPATDPLAPEPATDTSVAPETTVAPETSPAARERTPARTTRTTSRASTPRAASTAAAAPPATVAASEPVADPPAAAPAPIEAAPPVAVEPSAARQMQMNTILPILGAVAIALLMLAAAAAIVVRRRRRRRYETYDIGVHDEAESPAAPAELSPEPAFVPAVAVAAPAPAPVHDPIFSSAPASAPTTELPEGFDLSRFGPHMQAAYRGPTPDNPSLSLKYRLRKAAALDQRERATGAQEVETARPAAIAARQEPAPAGGDFMLRGDGTNATVRRAYSE